MTGKPPKPRTPRKSTQTTRKGAEIPVPKRANFMRDLRKVTTVPKLVEKPEG